MGAAFLLVLAIVIGLAAYGLGRGLGGGEDASLDAEIRSVQSVLEAYEANK